MDAWLALARSVAHILWRSGALRALPFLQVERACGEGLPLPSDLPRREAPVRSAACALGSGSVGSECDPPRARQLQSLPGEKHPEKGICPLKNRFWEVDRVYKIFQVAHGVIALVFLPAANAALTCAGDGEPKA